MGCSGGCGEGFERLGLVLGDLLEVERLRLTLEAVRCLHWARSEPGNVEDVVAVCRRVLDG